MDREGTDGGSHIRRCLVIHVYGVQLRQAWLEYKEWMSSRPARGIQTTLLCWPICPYGEAWLLWPEVDNRQKARKGEPGTAMGEEAVKQVLGSASSIAARVENLS